MIAWSIDAAKTSGVFDEVVVSTDDAEIAAIASQYGATVPFMRPPELSDDHAGTTEVIQHAIAWAERHGIVPETVCCLYATAPFVTPQALCDAFTLLAMTPCSYVFPVAPFDASVWRALRITPQQRLEPVWPEFRLTRSQDLETLYHDVGQFYVGRAAAWRVGEPVFGVGSRPIILEASAAQDIDTEDDWVRAERIFRAGEHRL